MDPGHRGSGNHTDISVITMSPGTLIIGNLLLPPPCPGTVNSHACVTTFPRMGVAPTPSPDAPVHHSLQRPPRQSCLSARRVVSPTYKAVQLQNPEGVTLQCLPPLPSPPSALDSVRMRRKGPSTPLHSAVSLTVTWTAAQLRPSVSQKIVSTAAT